MKAEGDKALYTYTVDGKRYQNLLHGSACQPCPNLVCGLVLLPPITIITNVCTNSFYSKNLGNQLVEKGIER